MANHPNITIDLQLTDRLGCHPQQAWNVAIHIGTLHDSSLIVRRLARNRRLLCVAPSYLEARGIPRAPRDLQAHDCIALRENDEDATLWRLHAGREVQAVRIMPKLTRSDATIVRDWALSGFSQQYLGSLENGRCNPTIIALYELPQSAQP